MLRPILAIVLLHAAVDAQQRTDVDLGRKLSDWFIYDVDGDGPKDFMAVFYTRPGLAELSFSLQNAEGAFAAPFNAEIDDVVAFAVGRFGAGGENRLVAIGPERARFFAVNATRDGLIETDTAISYSGLIRGAIEDTAEFWHWSTDLDGDGRDDLYLPADEGIEIHFGRQGGGFDAPVAIDLPGERTIDIGTDGSLDFVRRMPHPEFGDLDGDGRKDICWFDAEGLAYRLQVEARRFGEAKSFALPWLAGAEETDLLEQTDIDIVDIDADSRDDLVLARMRSDKGKIGDMKTTVVVLGNRGDEKELFPRRADAALKLAGVVGIGPTFADINADGKKDLVYGLYGGGIGDAVARFLGSVKVEFFIHFGSGVRTGPYSGTPDVTVIEKIDGDDFERWSARNNIFGADDLDGDGLADLVVLRRKSKGVHTWELRRGKNDGGSFRYEIEVSQNGDVSDLDSAAVRTLADGQPLALVLVRESGFSIVRMR